jgi:hypothetical protein
MVASYMVGDLDATERYFKLRVELVEIDGAFRIPACLWCELHFAIFAAKN